jgi:hypothetical protein
MATTISFNGTEIANLIDEISPILLAVVGLVGAFISLAVAFAVIALVRGILRAITEGVGHAIKM